MEEEPAALLGRVLGGYQLDGILAEGEGARVYEGWEIADPTHRVAIRVFAASWAPEPARAAFRDSFAAAAQRRGTFDHPVLLPLLVAAEDQGLLFTIVPLIADPDHDDPSLAGHLEQGPLALADVAVIAASLASGLDYLHAQAVFGNDLRPTNILRDGTGLVVIAEYGLPVFSEIEWLTTPFRAPEWTEHVPPTAASDQYALATLLTLLLIGSTPATESVVPDRLAAARPDLSKRSLSALKRGRLRDPAARFLTMRAFAAAFLSGFAGRRPRVVLPAKTMPQTPLRRTQRFLTSLTAFLVIVLVSTGTGYAVFQQVIDLAPTKEPTNLLTTTSTPCQTTITTPGSGGISTPPASTITVKSLKIAGPSSAAALFADGARLFDAHNGTTTMVITTSARQAFTDLSDGKIQIAFTENGLQDRSLGTMTTVLEDYPIAILPFAVYTNSLLSKRTGRITNLTTAQIRRIFLGSVTNWQQIGGPDEPITVIMNSGAADLVATFDRYLMGGTGTPMVATAIVAQSDADLLAKIAARPGAIGLGTTRLLGEANASLVSPLCIDGFAPTTANIDQGTYTFWSLVHAYLTGADNGTARAYLHDILGPQFQSTTVQARGYLPITDLSNAARLGHT